MVQIDVPVARDRAVNHGFGARVVSSQGTGVRPLQPEDPPARVVQLAPRDGRR